jgi:hypothetical protein
VTSAPSSVPTATAAPLVTPSAAPTESPVVTAEPTGTPIVEPSTVPTSEPTFAAGDRDLLFDDNFDDPGSGWDEVNESFATIGYESGALAFRFNVNPSWAYTVRQLGSPVTTLQPVAEFAPQSDGAFGLLCGDSLSGEFFGAIENSGGGIVFVEINGGNISVLERQDDLGLPVHVGSASGMVLRCNVDGLGGITLETGLTGTGPAAVYQQQSGAPIKFNVVGMYAESSSDGFSLIVSEAAAFGVGGSSGTLSDGAQELLSHVPSDFQDSCFESPIFSDDASYVLTCVLQAKGKGAEVAQFEQFDTKEQMDRSYQAIVDQFGAEEKDTCQDGPHETTWQLGDTVYGSLACADEAVGIRFDWTDDRLNILSTLIDHEGNYANTYEQWTNSVLVE